MKPSARPLAPAQSPGLTPRQAAGNAFAVGFKAGEFAKGLMKENDEADESLAGCGNTGTREISQKSRLPAAPSRTGRKSAAPKRYP